MTIVIERWIDNDSITLKKFQKIVKRVSKSAGLHHQNVSLSIVSDEEMCALNNQFRAKNYPTDVLTFTNDETHKQHGVNRFLGDIIIAYGVAVEQAKEVKHNYGDELMVLLIHGIAHLFGLDHERSNKEMLRQLEVEMTIIEGAGGCASSCLQNRYF